MNNDDNECSSISLSLFLDIVCIKAHLHYHACVWFYNEFDMINGTESFAHFHILQRDDLALSIQGMNNIRLRRHNLYLVFQ